MALVTNIPRETEDVIAVEDDPSKEMYKSTESWCKHFHLLSSNK